jgi:murein DD-endopeptidase MepM/ murein hydrolase activator NlpD
VLPPGTYRIGRGPAGHGYNARDLPVPTGTPVYAGVAGPVTRAAYMTTSYGIHTKVDGVLYAHLSKLFVRLGQQVLKGQRIGLSGSTGNSTGPHLHIEPDDRRLYDQGGILPPGGLAFNGTSRPEAVLSPRDSASLQQLVGSLRSAQSQPVDPSILARQIGRAIDGATLVIDDRGRGRLIARDSDLYGRTG